ncbi:MULTISPECIES: hypothetical protein [unclassified Nocardioides]|uniref:hypothetical protein n=1 Tax=unclassified Nocardioides TaxID=2615069 RepID=UPI000B144215|nr:MULTISPECIES: hypothetical protein [unclassified Nocardioides]
MYIGLGIVLLVVGLILALDVITADIKYVNEDALGTILIVAGLVAIVLSLIYAPPWRRGTFVGRGEDPRIDPRI